MANERLPRPRIHSLRTRVFLSSLLSTLALGALSLYSQLNSAVFLRSMAAVAERGKPAQALALDAAALGGTLRTYVATRSYSALKDYWAQAESIRLRLRDDVPPLAWDQGVLLRRELIGLVSAYLSATEEAIVAKRSRDADASAVAFDRAERIRRHIARTADEIVVVDWRESTRRTELFAGQLALLQTCNALMLVSLVALGVLLGSWFSNRLTAPLARLARAAADMAGGRYETPLAPYARDDEIGVLTRGFELMRENVALSFDALRAKAEAEAGFLEERLANLRMKNLLKNAELQALQSQVNPHFLFNTLNTGIQLAILEDADQTRAYIERLADVFRHNICRLDKPVPLSEELANLESYFYVMRVRFADRFDLRIEVDPDAPDPPMPAMVLQPLVENAITHGLRDCEEGGRVTVSVRRRGDGVELAVEDNGCGLPPAVQAALDAGGLPAPSGSGSDGDRKSNGVGLANVLQRMRLHFNDPGIASVGSGPGRGTRVSFRLPAEPPAPDREEPCSR